jgi:hypothetical protein
LAMSCATRTPATLVGVSPWHQSSMVVVFTSSCWIRH